MLQVVATGASGNYDTEHILLKDVKTNIFGNWPFKIGLSLQDFKQLLVDSGTIVQCRKIKAK